MVRVFARQKNAGICRGQPEGTNWIPAFARTTVDVGICRGGVRNPEKPQVLSGWDFQNFDKPKVLSGRRIANKKNVRFCQVAGLRSPKNWWVL